MVMWMKAGKLQWVDFLRIVNSEFYQKSQLFHLNEEDHSLVKFEEIKCILKPPTKVFKGKLFLQVFYRFSYFGEILVS